MLSKKFDFAKGQKTVTGVATFLLPSMFMYVFGIDIDQETIASLLQQVFEIGGAALTVYGLVMKFFRFIDTHLLALFNQ